jgi:cytidylate kinase
MEKERVVVTVSRQLGSGGSYIADGVAKELGIPFVDREILRQAAKELGQDDEVVEAYEERSSSLVERLVNVLSLGTPEHPYLPPSERPVYDRDLFVLESRIIKSIVDDHDAVIIGRGASYVLRDRPEAVHVFIHAPIAFRAERLMKAKKIKSLADARAAVEESDRRRSRFFKDMVGTVWTDARNYHVAIDSSIVGVDESVKIVVDVVRLKGQAAGKKPVS